MAAQVANAPSTSIAVALAILSCAALVHAYCPGTTPCNGNGSCKNIPLSDLKMGSCGNYKTVTNYRGKMKINLSSEMKFMSGLLSYFNKSLKARNYTWKTCSVLTKEVKTAFIDCTWDTETPAVGAFTKSGEKNKYLAGVESTYDGKSKGRKFKFLWCHAKSVTEKKCTPGSGWVNEAQGKLSFTCPGNMVISKIETVQDDLKGDRRWKFDCCELKEGGGDVCNCVKGWGGSACDMPQCKGSPMCSDRGNCMAQGPGKGPVCMCKDGYFGSFCQNKQCPGYEDGMKEKDMCSGNGKCDTATGKCKCRVGWTGKKCQWPKISYDPRKTIKALEGKAAGKGTPCHDTMKALKGDKASRHTNEHCYVAVKKRVDAKTARRRCERLGGHLVSITNDGEAGFVQGTFGSVVPDAWIGLVSPESPRHWTWMSGEIPVDGNKKLYGNWVQGQPTGNSGDGRCAIGQGTQLKWMAEQCGGQHPYVCEFENMPVQFKPIAKYKIPKYAKKFKERSNELTGRVRAITKSVREKVGRNYSSSVTMNKLMQEVGRSTAYMLRRNKKNIRHKKYMNKKVYDFQHNLKRVKAIGDGDLWSMEDDATSFMGSVKHVSKIIRQLLAMMVELKRISVRIVFDMTHNSSSLKNLQKGLSSLGELQGRKKKAFKEMEERMSDLNDKMELMIPKYLADLKNQRVDISGVLDESSYRLKNSTASLLHEMTRNVRVVRDAYTRLDKTLSHLQKVAAAREQSLVENAPKTICNCKRGYTVDYLAYDENGKNKGWVWRPDASGNYGKDDNDAPSEDVGMLCMCEGELEFKFMPAGDQTKFIVRYPPPNVGSFASMQMNDLAAKMDVEGDEELDDEEEDMVNSLDGNSVEL